MIVVYPMLVSRAVSENSIPGIAKAVENYLIIHKQANIINTVNSQKQRSVLGRMFSSAGRLMMKEDEDLLEAGPGPPPGSGPGSKGKGQVDPRTRQMYDEEQDILDKQWRDLENEKKKVEQKAREAEEKMRRSQDMEEKNRLAREKQQLDQDKFKYQQQQDQIKQRQKELDDQMRRQEKEEERQFRELEKEKERQARRDDKAAEKAEEREGKKKEKAEEEKKKMYDDIQKAKVDVKTTADMKSITLEPTYMTVQHIDRNGNTRNEFIGVKVVPIRVKSDVKLSHLLLFDTKVNALFALALRNGRKILRRVWGFFDKWTARFRVGGLTASGDPRRDILMGRTGMGKDSDSFIVLSKQEDVDEFFLDNIQKINRLFNMGWSNFIIADDVARTAWFCMESFRGMCNAVPYAMMYQQFGQSKAYETMEDAKKANSSIFKISKRFSRIVGERKAELLLNKYSQLSEGDYNE